MSLTAKPKHTVLKFASEFAKKSKFLAATLADVTLVETDADVASVLVFVACSTA